MTTFTLSQHAFKSRLVASLFTLFLLSACSSDSDDNENSPVEEARNELAVVATVAADYSAGAHAVIGTEAPFTLAQDNVLPTISDITVAAHGEHFYRIEKFESDSVARFHASDPATPLTQFSTLDAGETGSSNPYDLVFASESKAYLLRYGKSKAWIVNPAAETQAEYKLGEIDLSAYDSGDGAVEMAAGVIVNDKLFIVMQRLDAAFSPQDAYVAVVDTTTDTEIDTETSVAYKGILLPVENPLSIQVDETGLIYVQGIGSAYSDPIVYSGGIATIDPNSYETSLLIDDGDETNHPYGSIGDMEIVSSTKGYFVSYLGWQNNVVYAFNPLTSTVEETPLDMLEGLSISGLAVDADDRLWVSISSTPTRDAGIRVYNSDDNLLVSEEIATTLDPKAIVFVDAAEN